MQAKCNIRREKIANLNEKWDQTKVLMADKNRDLASKKQIIREITEAQSCYGVHVSDGKVGNVAVGIGGNLVPPPLSASQAEHYFGNMKGFSAIMELVDIKNGVSVKTSVTNLDPTRAM